MTWAVDELWVGDMGRSVCRQYCNQINAYLIPWSFLIYENYCIGNAISIQATDPAGNTGGRTLEVSLDTVPPRLMSVTPASGSTVAVAATRVAGTFDDAATVTITWSGGTKTVSTKEFSFDVVLLAGANTLTLSAIDAAGNVASVPLTLTFNPVQYDPVDAPYLSV